MAKTYKKLDAPVQTYLTNPSIAHINNNLITRTKKQFLKNGNKALVLDGNTGEHIGHMGAVFLEEKTVDTEQFIKLFTAGVEELMGLTSAGLKIFRLIYELMLETPNTDFFTLDFKTLKALKRWDYSQPTFNSGLNELLSKSIIFKSVAPAQYFVNVALFYNGDRITLVRSFQRKTTESKNVDLLTELEENNNFSEIDNTN